MIDATFPATESQGGRFEIVTCCTFVEAATFSVPMFLQRNISMMSTPRISYFTDLEKSVVSANFIKRGWVAADADEEWNFYW